MKGAHCTPKGGQYSTQYARLRQDQLRILSTVQTAKVMPYLQLGLFDNSMNRAISTVQKVNVNDAYYTTNLLHCRHRARIQPPPRLFRNSLSNKRYVTSP
jgi:hypothetical protein